MDSASKIYGKPSVCARFGTCVTQSCYALSVNPQKGLYILLSGSSTSKNTTCLISHAGQMTTYGIPNDALQTLNPIFVLITVPVLERWNFPYMQKTKLSARATVRMTIGFVLTAASVPIAAGV
jgi:dipeptide/tripeptide permease